MSVNGVRQLLTLKGHGTLRSGGKDLGRVEYEILVTTGPGIKRADGTFRGDAHQLFGAFNAGQVTLVRDDTGYEMKVILTSLNGDGTGTIAVSGSPGPLKQG